METQTTNRVSTMKQTNYLIFTMLFLSLISCTHGNCRTQAENADAALATSAVKTVPIQEISKMKETSAGQRIKIYKADGTLQCGQGKKIALEQMKKELKDIKVHSQTNKNDGKMRIQLCGSPTGNCNIYEIDRENLDQALKLGFKEWTGDL